MRVSIRGLDTGFVYPCTKREVVEVFGKDLVDSARFEARYSFSECRQGKKKPFRGVVLAEIHVYLGTWNDNVPWASLRVYRVRESEFSVHVGHELVRNMKAVMRPWTERKLQEVERSLYRGFGLIANYSATGLELFELRSTMNNFECIKIESVV